MRTFGKREWIAVGVAVVAAAMLFFGGQIMAVFFGSQVQSQNEAGQQGPSAATTTESTATTSLSTTTMQNISTVQGLEIYDEKVGTGPVATPGHDATVQYVGYLTDGTKFDASADHGQPFTFSLGAGQVIKGWDLGVAGMKAGGVRRLVISPALGYGARAAGSIPPNSTLIFEVELVAVK